MFLSSMLGKGYLPSLVPLHCWLLLGNNVGPLLLTPSKGGWPEGPQGDSRAIKDSVLFVGVSLWFATLEPELTDCPPFSVGFWHNPYCHMNYLDYL